MRARQLILCTHNLLLYYQDAFKGASSSSEPEAEKAANQATNAAGDIGEKVEDAASDVKDSIAERSGEARKWIDNWKNEQAK